MHTLYMPTVHTCTYILHKLHATCPSSIIHAISRLHCTCMLHVFTSKSSSIKYTWKSQQGREKNFHRLNFLLPANFRRNDLTYKNLAHAQTSEKQVKLPQTTMDKFGRFCCIWGYRAYKNVRHAVVGEVPPRNYFAHFDFRNGNYFVSKNFLVCNEYKN